MKNCLVKLNRFSLREITTLVLQFGTKASSTLTKSFGVSQSYPPNAQIFEVSFASPMLNSIISIHFEGAPNFASSVDAKTKLVDPSFPDTIITHKLSDGINKQSRTSLPIS